MKNKGSKTLELITFTLPAFVCVVLVTIIPFLMNIYYSFYKWNGISENMKFVGFANFIRVFTVDEKFWNSFSFTFRFTIAFVIIVNILAIFLATKLTDSNKLVNFSRSLFFIPYIISLVAISLTWQFILGPGFNFLYEATEWAFFNQSWLGASDKVFYTVVFISIWQNAGFYAVIYIAGLLAIPTSILEAAAIDGASKRSIFMKIKLPLLMPSLTICFFHAITFGLKIFDIILVLTKGGPGNSTESIAYHIFKQAFISNRYGLATSKSLVLFVVVLLITMIQIIAFKGREVEY